MKVLKIVGLIVGLLIVGVILLGVFKKKFTYSSFITVNASPEQSWQAFQDTTQMKQWHPGFKSIKLKDGQFLQVGSVYELIIDDGRERMVMHETILAIDPSHEISYELVNDVLVSKYSYRFTPAENGTTHIESHYEVTGKSLMWRAVLYLSKSYLHSASQEQLTLFKKHLEHPSHVE
jgi:uncharacterized protein YndB with AHSA1/START domain